MLQEQKMRREQINPLWMLGYIARERSLYEVAREYVEEALVLARESGDRSGVTYGLEALAAIALEQGKYAEAEERITESLVLARDLGDNWEVARVLWLWALAVLSMGNYSLARTFLEESLILRQGSGDKRGLAYTLVMLGYVAAFEGQPERMRQLIEEGLPLHREAGDRRGSAEALLGLGWAHLLLRNGIAARETFEECFVILRELGRSWFLALALEGLAMSLIALRQWERALRCWGAAQALREAKGIVPAPAIAALYEPFLKEVRAQFAPEELALLIAKGGDQLNDPELLAAPAPGLAPVADSSVATAPGIASAGLTAREVEVLRWVARGLTDQQVGEKLVISPRTVSTHLTSIYNKLGVSSRSAATRFAVEQQLL